MNFRDQYNQLIGKRNGHIERKKKQEVYLIELDKTAEYVQEAMMWIQNVSMEVQNQIKFNIENIVNIALSTVFEDPYEFRIKFSISHNKTEASMVLYKWDKEFNPMTENGGGVVDIVSLALRVAMYKLYKPQLSPIFILDEPFKNISEIYKDKAYEMLQNLQKELKLQFIFVTHEQGLQEYGDTVYKIIKRGKFAKIRRMK